MRHFFQKKVDMDLLYAHRYLGRRNSASLKLLKECLIKSVTANDLLERLQLGGAVFRSYKNFLKDNDICVWSEKRTTCNISIVKTHGTETIMLPETITEKLLTRYRGKDKTMNVGSTVEREDQETTTARYRIVVTDVRKWVVKLQWSWASCLGMEAPAQHRRSVCTCSVR